MDIRNRDWLELVKATSERFGISLQEVHEMILADDEMLRLIAHRINHNPECRNMALQDIARNRDESRFVKDAELIRFRRLDAKRP
jgi:predicted nuclease of restriction endonuclease-like RecB superfamily